MSLNSAVIPFVLQWRSGVEVKLQPMQCITAQKHLVPSICVRLRRPESKRILLIGTRFSNDQHIDLVEQLEDSDVDGNKNGTDNHQESEVAELDATQLSLQVQSLEEQRRLAATPVHPEGLYAMYATYVASCFMERVWRFGVPVLLSLLHNSMLPVAVLSFVGQLVIFCGGPCVGALMDFMPRVAAFNILSTIQTFAMLVSSFVIVHALRDGPRLMATGSALLLQPWFIVLMIAGAAERLSGLAAGIAFERDWVVLLAGPNRTIALANANALLRRVDLICEITGPFIFGILLSKYNPVTCIHIAAVVMVVSLPLVVLLVKYTDMLSKGVLDRPKSFNFIEAKGGPELWKEGLAVADGLHAIKRGWEQYLAQPILPASIAYVLLYFNAVLGPSGLMTSFLTQRGLNPSIIGTFRGACALMGFLATFVSARLISKFGILRAGATALVFQGSLLVLAVLIFWFIGQQSNLLGIFLLPVVVSRLGYWVYEMVNAQIFQMAIPASQANLIGTTEVSLGSLAELVMMGVAIVANDVSLFGYLAMISTLSVVAAAWLYWRWLVRTSQDQDKLFPNHLCFDT